MKFILLLAFSSALLPAWSCAEIIIGENPENGLRSWEWREAGVSLRLVQRLPDQTRAFFLARGFASDEVERIANACVFQTVFRNEGNQPLVYQLDDWKVLHGEERRNLLTRERWAEIWRLSEASKAARISLHWAHLPTRQKFEPGDYNWGMTSFGLPPGEIFDLNLEITLGSETIRRTITGIVCADDVAEILK